MNIQLDSLAHVYLNMASGDWVDIDDANAHAKDFETNDLERKMLVIATMRSLAEAGYLRIGSVEYVEPERTLIDFFEWPGTLDEKIERLSGVYMPDGRDDKDWGWACMFEITDEGRRVEDALPAPDDRFFD